MSMNLLKKAPKKDREAPDGSSATGDFAYHWSYADYQSSLSEKLNTSGKRRSRVVSLMLAISVILSLASVAVFFITLETVRSTKTDKWTQPSEITAQSNTEIHDDDYIARCIGRFNAAALQIVDDVAATDGKVTGIGFLLENGYILTDITAFRSAKPGVVDTEGTRVNCTVLFSDLNTHLAVLLPDETISARGLSVSTVAFTGQSVYRVGFYPDDPSNMVAELTNICYQDADGYIRIVFQSQEVLQPLSVICDMNMQLIGAYTTNGRYETMDQLAGMIEAAQQELLESEDGFEEYLQVDFPLETKLVAISYENAALYHIPTGIRLTEVKSGSAAEAAGFCVGDIINTVDGVIIKNVGDFNEAIAAINDPFYSVSVYRDGKYYNVKLRTPQKETKEKETVIE